MKNEVLLPADLLDEIIKYIEKTEETIDGEWGSGRKVKELVECNYMPELYYKILALKKHS